MKRIFLSALTLILLSSSAFAGFCDLDKDTMITVKSLNAVQSCVYPLLDKKLNHPYNMHENFAEAQVGADEIAALWPCISNRVHKAGYSMAAVSYSELKEFARPCRASGVSDYDAYTKCVQFANPMGLTVFVENKIDAVTCSQ